MKSHSRKPHHYRVGIAGFGIAGGALAVLLARAGHSVTLFERAPQVGPVGAGFLLQPSGQQVLRRLGLLDSLIPHSEPIYALHAFKARGRTLVHLRYSGAAPGCHAYGVHRGILFETLHAAARAANVTIQLNHQLVTWRETKEGVLAVDAQGQTHGPFDFLAGTDGSRSNLRHTLNPTLAPREYEFGAAWAVGRCTQVRQYLHQVTDGTRALLGLLPIGNEQATLFWGVRRDQMTLLRQGGFRAWRETALRLCPLAEELFADIGAFERVVFAGYQQVTPPHLYNHRVVLLGDAAHAMSPHLGQGANLALLDAECLAHSLQETEEPAAAFRLYCRTRAAQNGYYSTLSRILTPFFQSDAPLLGVGRDLTLPLMTAIPPLRKQMELSLAGVKHGLFSSTLDMATIYSK